MAELTKTTLIGGLLVVLPIYVSLLLLAKTLAAIVALLAPGHDGDPGRRAVPAGHRHPYRPPRLLRGRHLGTDRPRAARQERARARGCSRRSRAMRWCGAWPERVSGNESEGAFRPALVEVEEALAPAFIIEELEDGRYTVPVPSVPTPATGSLFIVQRERVHPVDVPFTQAVRVISKWARAQGRWPAECRFAPDRI